MAIDLNAESTFGRVTLDWVFDGTVDIVYSTDPDCDWENYSTCPNGQMLPSQTDGLTLGREDGLELNRNYFFVAQVEDTRSDVVGAAPWAPGVARTLHFTHPRSPARAAVIHDGTWYVVGHFSHAAPTTGQGIIVDADEGRLFGPLQKVLGMPSSIVGQVSAVAPDGSGGWYIGGNFTSVAGQPRQGLARIRANGTLDPDWNPPAPNGVVLDFLVVDETVYVAGLFTSLGGVARGYGAAVDAHTGELTDWNPQADNHIKSLAYAEGRIFAGGLFSQIGGAERSCRVAAFDATTGALLYNWDPGPRGELRMASIRAMTVFEEKLFVGGDFWEIGGEERDSLAALDLGTGAVTNWEPEPELFDNSTVIHALVAANETLYVGSSHSGIITVDTSTGARLSKLPDFDGRVTELSLSGDRLYAGGSGITRVDGVERANLVAFATISGAVTDWNPGAYGRVMALAVNDDTVYAGGRFAMAGGEARPHGMAAFDPITGELSPWMGPRDTSTPYVWATQVRTLAASEGIIYAGGFFTEFGEDERLRLAAFDAETGELTDWNPGVDHTVQSLAVTEGNVLVGGNFSKAGGEERPHLAAFDADTGVLADWNPAPDGSVLAIEVSGSRLYAGGAFTTVNGAEHRGLAAFDTTTLAMTDWSPAISEGHAVRAMTFAGQKVYVGGVFSQANGEDRTNLAAFDAETGELADWNPGAGSTVNALQAFNGTIYAGGGFTEAGGETRYYLAAFDDDTGGLMSNWQPATEPDIYSQAEVRELSIFNGHIYAAGEFTPVRPQSLNGLLILAP